MLPTSFISTRVLGDPYKDFGTVHSAHDEFVTVFFSSDDQKVLYDVKKHIWLNNVSANADNAHRHRLSKII